MSPIISKLPILVLYAHSRCNCRCVMCDIWNTSDSREISPADLDRHAGDIRALGVEWVVLSGGEPLMHSDLFALCRRLREFGVRITILSTGLLLQRYARELVEHVDEIIVSLDGPPEVHNRIRRVAGAFERLSEGVAALLRLRSDLPVSARCVVQKHNCASLVDTAHAARAMSLRSVSFLAADLTSTAFNRAEPWPIARQDEVGLSAAELSTLERQIELLAESNSDGFVLEGAEKLRRIIDYFRAHLGLATPVAPRCNAPWISAVWESGGTLRPCFFHQPIGNVNGTSLAEALNGPKGVAFREKLHIASNATCSRCVCSLYLPQASS